MEKEVGADLIFHLHFELAVRIGRERKGITCKRKLPKVACLGHSAEDERLLLCPLGKWQWGTEGSNGIFSPIKHICFDQISVDTSTATAQLGNVMQNILQTWFCFKQVEQNLCHDNSACGISSCTTSPTASLWEQGFWGLKACCLRPAGLWWADRCCLLWVLCYGTDVRQVLAFIPLSGKWPLPLPLHGVVRAVSGQHYSLNPP